MRVLLKVMVGNCSTFRKSGDLRCASRRASLVINEWVSIVASTEETVKSSSLRLIAARTLVKCPFTVMRPMCLAENSTCVCIGSTDQLMYLSSQPGRPNQEIVRSTIVAKHTIVKSKDHA